MQKDGTQDNKDQMYTVTINNIYTTTITAQKLDRVPFYNQILQAKKHETIINTQTSTQDEVAVNLCNISIVSATETSTEIAHTALGIYFLFLKSPNTKTIQDYRTSLIEDHKPTLVTTILNEIAAKTYDFALAAAIRAVIITQGDEIEPQDHDIINHELACRDAAELHYTQFMQQQQAKMESAVAQLQQHGRKITPEPDNTQEQDEENQLLMGPDSPGVQSPRDMPQPQQQHQQQQQPATLNPDNTSSSPIPQMEDRSAINIDEINTHLDQKSQYTTDQLPQNSITLKTNPPKEFISLLHAAHLPDSEIFDHITPVPQNDPNTFFVIAGGMVAKILDYTNNNSPTKRQIDSNTAKENEEAYLWADCDIFAIGEWTPELFQEALKRFQQKIQEKAEANPTTAHQISAIYLTQNSCTFKLAAPRAATSTTTFRFYRKPHQTITQLLLTFDVDAAAVAYIPTKQTMYALPRAVRAWKTRVNHYNYIDPVNNITRRIAKYKYRGFDFKPSSATREEWQKVTQSMPDPETKLKVLSAEYDDQGHYYDSDVAIDHAWNQFLHNEYKNASGKQNDEPTKTQTQTSHVVKRTNLKQALINSLQNEATGHTISDTDKTAMRPIFHGVILEDITTTIQQISQLYDNPLETYTHPQVNETRLYIAWHKETYPYFTTAIPPNAPVHPTVLNADKNPPNDQSTTQIQKTQKLIDEAMCIIQ